MVPGYCVSTTLFHLAYRSVGKLWNGQCDEPKSSSCYTKDTCAASASQRLSGKSDSLCQTSICEETLFDSGGERLINTTTTENETSKRIVCQAFRFHYSDLATRIVHPEKLAGTLYAKCLIARGTKEAVQTTLGISNAQKAALLLNAFESTLITSDQPLTVLKGFCQAVKKERTLKPILRRMKETVGKHCLIMLNSDKVVYKR